MVQIPKIADLYNSIQDDFQANLGITLNPFGKAFVSALIAVQAAKLKLYYLALANVQKNIFADTADPVSMGGTLERFGFIKLGRNPNGAIAAEYNVTVTGTAGAVLRASLTFKSDDNSASPGMLFILDDEYTLVGTTGTILLRALTGGIASKLLSGNTLTVTEPVANLDATGTVTGAAVTEPIDAETTEQYRDKVLAAYRSSVTGGSATDYRLWASDVSGVQKVYPYAKSGAPNEINVFVESETSISTDGKGTPSSTMLTNVANAIQADPNPPYKGRKPLGVFRVNVLPVTIKQVDINISGFVGLTADIQTAITNALTDSISKMRPFIDSDDLRVNKNDILDTNRIVAVILSVQPGAVFGSVTLEIDSAPLSTFQFINGNIPWLNAVTYV